jgi:transcriptional regulator with XRE-family HTH domain
MTDINDFEESLAEVEEGFVVDVQLFLHEMMVAKKVSRAELARRMNVSRGRISQIFSDDCKNLTIRLLAKATHALGEVPSIDSAITRALREEREEETRNDAISRSANVVPLWRDVTENSDLVDRECGSDDVRLGGIVKRLRAGGVR